MDIKISDDFNLDKITNSGQAFRIKKFDDDTYRFIFKNHILYIKKIDEEIYSIKTIYFDNSNASEKDEWDTIWRYYFDLDRNYSDIRKLVPEHDTFLSNACDYGAGLRILKQDAWEMLITFIISQRKSIPAIKDSIERICEKYGRLVRTDYEDVFLFPSAKEMVLATEEELKECKLGYRISYIQDAVKQVSSETLNMTKLSALSYDNLFTALKTVRGVGDKVSNCICLFAYAKTSAAPVDTWIAKVIEKFYNGINPFPSFGDVAGIMQQYIFYYAQMHKDEF